MKAIAVIVFLSEPCKEEKYRAVAVAFFGAHFSWQST